jgi:hypothetical protein
MAEKLSPVQLQHGFSRTQNLLRHKKESPYNKTIEYDPAEVRF